MFDPACPTNSMLSKFPFLWPPDAQHWTQFLNLKIKSYGHCRKWAGISENITLHWRSWDKMQATAIPNWFLDQWICNFQKRKSGGGDFLGQIYLQLWSLGLLVAKSIRAGTLKKHLLTFVPEKPHKRAIVFKGQCMGSKCGQWVRNACLYSPQATLAHCSDDVMVDYESYHCPDWCP